MLKTLSQDTQATLLLYARWGKDIGETAALTLNEYNQLASWLRGESMRPGELLSQEGMQKYNQKPLAGIEPARIESLLRAGGVMTLQVEQWLNNGFWVLSRSDDEYPSRFRKVLKSAAPPLMYGIGPVGLLSGGGVAVVGSRDVDEKGASFAQELGEACAMHKLIVISGGARGVDQTAMAGALNNGGCAIGVLASGIAQIAVKSGNREVIQEERLVLTSPYHPKAVFNVGQAMGRNKLIYALADATVVVSSSFEQGGTWAGAIENIKKWHTPIFVREEPAIIGNIELIKKGAKPFTDEALKDPSLLIPEETTADQTGGVDGYELILPNLLEYTQTPRNRKSIISFLDVAPGQASKWLKRAVEEKKIEKTKSPVRYVTIQDPDNGVENQPVQYSLF